MRPRPWNGSSSTGWTRWAAPERRGIEGRADALPGCTSVLWHGGITEPRCRLADVARGFIPRAARLKHPGNAGGKPPRYNGFAFARKTWRTPLPLHVLPPVVFLENAV